MKITSIVILFALLCGNPAVAQDIRSDYRSGPVHYQPEDPWVRGKIFQIHTGHGGWFYNCDHQEDKRFSPYINWNRQPCWKAPECPIKYDIHQQLGEVARRICWGKGECCHKTDRLPPNPANATPIVETFQEVGHQQAEPQQNESAPQNNQLSPEATEGSSFLVPGNQYRSIQRRDRVARSGSERTSRGRPIRRQTTSSRREKSAREQNLVDQYQD